MRKKIEDIDLENKILHLLEWRRSAISIKQITKLLKDKYQISRSPQVIKRHLILLRRKGKIIIDMANPIKFRVPVPKIKIVNRCIRCGRVIPYGYIYCQSCADYLRKRRIVQKVVHCTICAKPILK